MAQNSIGYEGRIIANSKPIELTQTTNGLVIMKLVVAEQHSEKMKSAKRNPALAKYVEEAIGKGDDDFINTTTSWHRLTIMGDKAAEYAQDPGFNHGALITVENASYSEEGDWETKDGVKRAGRPEIIGEKKGVVTVKFPPRVDEGKTAPGPIWDGIADLPRAGGNSPAAREYNENEGF